MYAQRKYVYGRYSILAALIGNFLEISPLSGKFNTEKYWKSIFSSNIPLGVIHPYIVSINTAFYSHWFEQDIVRPDPSWMLLLPGNLYQPLVKHWVRYFVVVNVYKTGLTAEFKGKTKTTRNPYKSPIKNTDKVMSV